MGLGGLNCGAKCAKVLLLFFNFIFWLCGGTLLGLGVWFLVDSASLNYVASFLAEVDGFKNNDDSLKLMAYLYVAVGCFIFIVAFCGCWGAWKEVQCLLGLYIFFIVITIGLEIAGGVIVAIYQDRVLDHIEDEGSKYANKKYTNTKAADYGLNWIQYEWKCCGVRGPRDYLNSTFSRAASNQDVSHYCCQMTSGYEFDKRVADVDQLSNCLVEAQACQAGTCSPQQQLYQKGCFQAIKKWVQANLPIFIGFGFGIVAIEIFGLILAICLCRQIGKEK